MANQFFAPTQKDAYKVPHPTMYLKDIQGTHSNYTNRFGKHSNIAGNDEVMLAGLQYFILSVLIKDWNETFFDRPKEEAVGEYSRIVNSVAGTKVSVTHMQALHDLGYLPLEIRAVEEGTTVPYGVPSITIDSTEEGFGWCSNMIETVMSSEISGICTSATTALAYRTRFEKEPSLAESGMCPFLGHDFSYRGMLGGTQHAAMSGFGHAISFLGSDTLPVIGFAEKWYGERCDESPVICSVSATEHSVATSFILCVVEALAETGEWNGITLQQYEGMFNVKDLDPKLMAEIIYMQYLMTEVVPEGVLSLVCDSFDFWGIIQHALPALKPFIEGRKGTIVIRPDSGDPVEVICGLDEATAKERGACEYERKGLIECLGDLFGTTRTSEGLKALPHHIGAIYGDSITLERQDQIIEGLKAKGLVPFVVLGIGSFTYQYVTRDTHGSAVKATNVTYNGKDVAICKDPKTDRTKKSAKGILMVVKNSDGKLALRSEVSREEQRSDANELKVVFRNGKLLKRTTLEEIRERVNARFS